MTLSGTTVMINQQINAQRRYYLSEICHMSECRTQKNTLTKKKQWWNWICPRHSVTNTSTVTLTESCKNKLCTCPVLVFMTWLGIIHLGPVSPASPHLGKEVKNVSQSTKLIFFCLHTYTSGVILYNATDFFMNCLFFTWAH